MVYKLTTVMSGAHARVVKSWGWYRRRSGELISTRPPGVGQLILTQVKSPLNPDIARMGVVRTEIDRCIRATGEDSTGLRPDPGWG